MRILKELRGSATPARPAIHPLEVTERAGAATHLLSSLEYVVRPQDRTLGGLNHWASMREGFPDSLRWMVPIYDYFSHEGRLGALHASRAVAAAILLVPRSTPHSGHRTRHTEWIPGVESVGGLPATLLRHGRFRSSFIPRSVGSGCWATQPSDPGQGPRCSVHCLSDRPQLLRLRTGQTPRAEMDFR